MKAKQRFSFLFLFLWILIIQSIHTEDSCPNGMRKTYLDETTASEEGSARNYVPAINFYEGNGALWYRRKVLIEPRFEVHLKVSIDPVDVVESSKEYTLEGFTIVISKNKNQLSSGTSDYMGYYGFTKSYVVEFDFEKSLNDPDDSSYSFKYCDSDCSNDDTKAYTYGKLTSQRFDPTSTMNWDFRLIYIDKKLYLYSGSNTVIFTYNVDLYKVLESNTAYVGFTGYMNGNRRELNVLGTFICEDNFDISRMNGKFYVNEKELDTYTYKAGETVQYLFSFINNKGQVIPHCFKQGIWSYSFSLSLDCQASNLQIRMKDEYNLFLSMNACNVLGEHTIGISEASHGVGPEKTYTIIGGGLDKITLIGHDGVVGNLDKDSTVSNGIRTLTYGSSDGDFSLKSESISIVLDFELKDSLGNDADIGSTSSEMLSNSGFSLAKANSATLTMKKVSSHYQLIITITKTGSYEIVKNSFMSETIKFTVITGGISTSDSYCTIEGYSQIPTLKQGETAYYNCYFKDGRGQLIDIAKFLSFEEYDFSCKTKRTSPSSKQYINQATDKGTYYQCPLTISESGVYQFYGYLTPKGKTTGTITIKANIDKVYVSASYFSMEKSKIYDYYSKSWVDIDKGVIEYRNDYSGKLTSLDLADSNGVLISKYKAYPEDFDASKIKVEVTSTHDLSYSFGEFYCKIYTLGGIEYIGIFNSKNVQSDKIFRRSSFDYTLKITYTLVDGTVEEKTVTLRYNENDLRITGYTACFHEIDYSKTKIEMETNIKLLTDNEQKIGHVELRTTDGYLYNYDIGKSYIVITLEKSVQFSYRIVTLSVAGTYDIYVTVKESYSGEINLKIKDQTVKTITASAQESLGCYLSFKESNLFKSVKSENKEYYYEYIGDYIDGNLQFFFTLTDRNYKSITRSNYFETNTDISCLQYENDNTKYTVTYNKTVNAFQFKDNLEFKNSKYTWVFIMKDETCYNKYYITYDQANIQTSVSTTNSYFSLLTNQSNINEFSYIDVYLKDGNNAFMGITSGKLEQLKYSIVIKAKDTKTNQVYTYQVSQITSNYAIRFSYYFTVASTFEISVYYRETEIKVSGSSILTVTAAQFSLKHSKLQMITDSTIDASIDSSTTIQNNVQVPMFNLYLYTSSGEKTTFDSSSTFTCKITGEKVNIELTANKYYNYVQFTFVWSDRAQFQALSTGTYTLTITADGQTQDYQLYLLGDGETDYSNDKNYDITKTDINPTHIDGVVGKTLTINVELRASDGLRWNYEGNTYSFYISNSYGLYGDKIVTSVAKGYKKGQFIISVTQKTITEKGDNILTIYYENKVISQTISLSIQASQFGRLKLVDGPTEGNVLNPPILTFKTLDTFENEYNFNSSISQEYLNSLTVAKSLDGVSLTVNCYLTSDHLLKVQYKTTISTNVAVTSQYFENPDVPINYRIKSGSIDPETSYAEMKSTVGKAAGSNYTIVIYPKDSYLNDIDDLNINDMNKFLTYYEIVETGEKITVSNCELVEGYSSAIDVIIRKLVEEENVYDSIECSTPISYIGNIAYHVSYVEKEIECRNCVFSVLASQFEFKNTQTFYKNKEYYFSIEKKNEVEAKKEPTFEITFYDQFKNIIIDNEFIAELNIIATFVGADIKLCVSTSGNKKIATLCPSSNGDDNINKWQYITNGDNYKLIVQEKDVSANIITYPIKIIGGDEGSSDEVDYSKTNFNPTNITVQAGVEGKTIMELRTKDEKRKNYWFPDISDKIKVEFNSDKDTCSYKVEKGDKPGQYAIKVTCTKVNNNNGFTVTVDSNKINQNIKLVVTNGPAYYLVVEEKDKFTSSGDKYTWKTNPTNDDEPYFLFKLQDKYLNYISTSVIGTNQITITSETFGNKYYKLEFSDKNKNYNFTDEIKQAVTKHTWNIVCVESNKKYSFIYTRVPGKVNIDKSYWSIDKTEYIVQETSTVLIVLNDKYGVNVGTVSGRLEKEKEKVKVVANSEKDLYSYSYSSITNEINLKYTYIYEETGKYQITISYDNQQIKEKVEIIVSYQTIDIKTSKLYYDIGDGKENLMITTAQTNINNLEVCPYYKFYFYTSKGEKVTLYDNKLKMESFLTFNKVNSWTLDVAQKTDYIYIAHKDCNNEFKKLPQGLYELQIVINNSTISYPVYLMGEKDVSIYQIYEIDKTYIKPSYIDGIAGKRYQVDIEFRGKDGLRWNYEINTDSLVYTNSYGLDTTNLIIEKVVGEKNGQMKLYITQKVATTGREDNIITLTYQQKKISQTITLHIKCAEKLYQLIYVSGAVDSTVVNPSIVKFTPVDEYGNLYTDLFNVTKYTKVELEKLTKGQSEEKYELTTNNYVSEEKYLNVQYSCKKVTTIIITTEYNSNQYKYKLWSGPIDSEKSYAKIENTNNVIAGDNTKLIVYPRDVYENIVTNITKTDLEKFEVNYVVDIDYNKEVTCNTGSFSKDNFSCETKITKSGEVKFIVDYEDKNVKCINCEFSVGPDKLDFSKTKVYNKNEDKELSKTELNTLPVTVTPNFLLNFFDKYENAIVNKTEVELLKVSTQIIVTDVKLCTTNKDLNKLSTLCKSQNNDENEERWQYIPNGKEYKLIVTETTKNENLTYPIELTGGYTDSGSGPIDQSKTYFAPSEITLTAGEEGEVFMELRTEDEKRKNYWFKDTDKNIKVKFPDEVKNCSYSIGKDEKPGQYNIKFKCYKKTNAFKTVVVIEDKEVPKQITITVVPNSPAKSQLFRLTGEEITTYNLGTVSVEDQFQMINKLYDQYDNLITNINFNLALLQIKMAPINNTKSHTWSADTTAQANGEILITLKSTFAKEHIVVGAYFPLEKYSIVFTPGEAYADNCKLEVSHTERYVGEEVKIYITAYDKYNNYIDSSKYKDSSPFQVKYANEGNTLKVIMEKYSIQVKDSLNVLSYPGTFYVRGTTTIYGYIDSKQIQCVSCRINIKSRDIDFLSYDAKRYDSNKKAFEALKNGTVEKNEKEEPIYRLYPKDQYGNTIDIIPEDTLIKYTAYLSSQSESTVYNLKLNNNETKNQEYAEFAINDVEGAQITYKTLVGGFYDLVFTDGKNKLVFNITLAGDGKGGSNEPADIQHTHINEQNLRYVAGNNGYMIIEIRTKNNIRKNFWDGFTFNIKSCDKTDKTFNFTQQNAGTYGVFYITVTSQKANTYPSLTKCPLEIYVNDELVESLKPEMEVLPDSVVKTEILPKYYKDGKTSAVLVDGNTDTNYVFEVASYDKYNNLAETVQEVVGIKVSLKGGEEITKTTSETETSTGYRKYTVPATKSGTYVVSTDKSGPKGLYLANESIFTIHPGSIDISKTVVKEKATPIQAGSKPAITIEAFDKYGNALYIKDYQDKFTSTFIDPKSATHKSSSSYDEVVEKVVYISETAVTIIGNVKVTVVYNNKDKIDTSKVVIVVIPGDPDPNNSILSREISKGSFTQYKNGDSFTVNIYEVLLLNVTLYDKYNNFISNIPADANVLEPIMSGNYMTEIKFDVTKNTACFVLDFNDNEKYVHIYQHLVKGTYDLNYKVKTVLGEASFKYNIIVSNGDDNHGNGPYVIEKCVLTPKNVSFVAGTYEEFTLELRTEQGLLYNDEIDIENDTLIKIEKEEKSFTSSIAKSGSVNGIYTITIYSEKKGANVMNVFLTDLKSEKKEKKNVGPANYYVYPEKVPHQNYTVIINKPDPKISSDMIIEISFTLADRFDNLFEGREDIIENDYLTVLNNNEPIPVISTTLLPDGKTFKITLYPKYPPKIMKINVLYSDEENSVKCFKEDMIIEIGSTIDYDQTEIISKNKERITVGELLDMWLYTFDSKGECIEDQDYSSYYEIIVSGPIDSYYRFTKTYSVERIRHINDSECDNEYKIITKEEDIYKYAGNYIIRVYGGGKLIAQYNQVCIPLGYSLFLLEYDFNPDRISVLDSAPFVISGTDKYGNILTDPLYDDITISLSINGENFTKYETDKYEIKSGELNYDLEVHVAGSYQLHMYYKGVEVNTVNNGDSLPIFTFVAGNCRAEDNRHFDISTLDGVKSERPVYFTFQCYDIYENMITTGGESFTVYGSIISSDIIDLDSIAIYDNNDGTYKVSFIPNMPGTYLIRLFVDEEKYGKDIEIEYGERVCSGETPVLCPNNQCAKDYYGCIIPPNGCPIETPFKCKVNNTEGVCVKSQIECDCPSGYIRCSYMKYCVPEDRPDMCPKYKYRKCSVFDGTWIYHPDGICRPKTSNKPNQIVCPIGYVLCPDLTCRENHDLCARSEYLTSGQTRCVNQVRNTDATKCSSTITCPSPDQVVCNGECIDNEIYCKPLKECPDSYPFLCPYNECAAQSSDCASPIACGDGQSLCYDSICRESCD